MAKAPTRNLSRAERQEAMLVAEELLCQRVSEANVRAALRDQYRLSDGQAYELVADVFRNFRETVAAHAGERRAQHLRVLDRLFNRAWKDGKLNVCAEVEKLLAKVEGHEQPTRHVITPGAGAENAGAGESEDRTPEDLLYYAAHGYFPEDAPAAAPAGAGGSPRDFPLH